MSSMAAFDYDLPPWAVAQEPAEPRPSARLLVAVGDSIAHATVGDLPGLLGPGDVVVVNDTRVLPARLRLTKPSGGRVEVLLLEQGAPDGDDRGGDEGEPWQALVRPGRRVGVGCVLQHGARPAVVVGVPVSDARDGRRWVRLIDQVAVEASSSVPLPPYVRRPLTDPERYQTVYARHPGSVAAPTAGLHLDTEVLERCRSAGARVHAVDLAIGLGTFRPLTVSQVEDHRMHTERYDVPAETMSACAGARRVVAIGTTTLRALEAATATGRLSGRTDLYIHGPFPFAVVDVLLTNFHLPRSSLLVLVDAFCGPRWRDLYRLALDAGYRFLSFGDAMVVSRRQRR